MAGPGHPGRPTHAPGEPPPPLSASDVAAEAAARLADDLAQEGGDGDGGGHQAEQDDAATLAGVAAERDEYLGRLQRLQADFENYKKRVLRQQAEHSERAAEDLVVRLLPVLDTVELAMAHGAEGLDPVQRSLMGVLEAAGLARIDPAGTPFDPNEHDAVLHEEDEGGAPPEVIEVLRAGYRWKGRVLRPAMVKVKG